MIVEARDEDFAALLIGAPPRGLLLADGSIEGPEILGMLRSLARTVRAEFSPSAWMIVEQEEVVGLCSLKAPPEHGPVEIGYGVAASRRNRGIATRGVADLLAWAQADGQDFRLAGRYLSPQRAIAAGVGTQRLSPEVGGRTDVIDGEVFCWHRSITRGLQ